MIKGLPERLPEGERLIWQGAPQWRVLVRSMFHIRLVAAYFSLIILWCAGSSLRDGGAAATVAVMTAKMIGVALIPLALMVIYAWLTQRSTVYSITSRRVVIHFGVAFPMSFNIPFARVAAASLHLHADGSGDIPLQLSAGSKLGYLVMWPNVRPWRMAKAEPMLRGITDAARVAQLLSRALAASASMPVQAEAVASRATSATVGPAAAAAA